MKLSFTLFILIALGTSVSMAQNQSTAIYGWDISCKGLKGLAVHAHQSDDDFYIEYQGAGLPKGQVWADTKDQNDIRMPSLDFKSNQSVSPGLDGSLSVIRENRTGPGYGFGVFKIGTQVFDVNCFVRYGVDETDFDEVFQKPFPSIPLPPVVSANTPALHVTVSESFDGGKTERRLTITEANAAALGNESTAVGYMSQLTAGKACFQGDGNEVINKILSNTAVIEYYGDEECSGSAHLENGIIKATCENDSETYSVTVPACR